MADLIPIYNALFPENLKNNRLFTDTFDIFVKTIEEYSRVSVNINNVFSNTLYPTDSLPTKNAKMRLKSSLIEVNMNNVFTSIKTAQHNQILLDKLIRVGLDNIATISRPVESIISPENLSTNKSLSNKIATRSAIDYAYRLASHLESNIDKTPLSITYDVPQHMHINGRITREMYSAIVEPISHVAGYTYTYTKNSDVTMDDVFGLVSTYNVNTIEIRSSHGFYDVFIPGTTQVEIDAVWTTDFINRTNIVTGNLFTLTEFNTQVTVRTDMVVKEVLTMHNPAGREVNVHFVNGQAIILQPTISGVNDLLLVNYPVWASLSTKYPGAGLFRTYTPTLTDGHWVLFTDYTTNVDFSYGDVNIHNIDFEVTKYNDYTHTTTGLTYIDYNGISQPSGTSDVIKMTSTNYVNDIVDIQETRAIGNYLVGSDIPANASYFISTEVGVSLVVTSI